MTITHRHIVTIGPNGEDAQLFAHSMMTALREQNVVYNVKESTAAISIEWTDNHVGGEDA